MQVLATLRLVGRTGLLVAALVGCGGEAGLDVGVDAAAPAVVAPNAPEAPASVTYAEHIAPLVARRCARCHTDGGIAPFPLTTYDQVSARAAAMLAAISEGEMPPWGARVTEACRPRFGFKGDPRPTEAEVALLRRWIELKRPQGDATHAAPLPASDAGTLANPTATATMAAPYVVDGRRDQFRCFSVDPNVAQDVWMNGIEVRPGNGKVVHHVLVWSDPEGQGPAKAGADGSWECFGAPGFTSELLAAWAPGGAATETPPDVGVQLKQGSKLVLNVHYHPTGAPEADRTGVALRWTTTKPRMRGLMSLIGNFRTRNADGTGLQPGPNDPAGAVEFRIPANAADHSETLTYAIPSKLGAFPTPRLRVWVVGTHMHYVGRGMSIAVTRAAPTAGEPSSECLLDTPDWNFHWQRGYDYDAALDALPSLVAGDRLTMRCRYDNTMNNPWVAQALEEQGLAAPKDVVLGEQTLDEMCLGAFGVAFPNP